MARHADFTTIRTEGALLPPDLLRRLRDNDKELPGLTPDAYHLIGNTRISEAISEAWNKLQVAWNNFQDARANIPEGAPGTAATRDRWLLPLFQVLDYGRLQTTTAREVAGKDFPISHGWEHVPIHLVGCNVDLDTRSAGVAGAARQSPHGLVQAYLNTSDESLWGIVSNGLRLRLLRDHHALTRQAYLEFDLETMFTGEVYPDFVLLFLTLHQSRLEGTQPEDTILEQWARAAQEQGTRALDRLRDGVHDALTTLGQGFLEHPANTNLRTTLRDGTLTPQDYYRQLLRVVYRFLVLFAAEDRDLLHVPDTADTTRQRYAYYSTRRLRELADAIPGGRHPDQYQLLKRTWGWLGNDGAPGLGIPALGGFLFGPTATRDLDDAQLTNRHLLTAVRQLAFTQVNHARYPVDYKNLGAEELGSVYESLLELQPLLDTGTGGFALKTLSGNERKTTGSYYTPTSLITLLLDSALNPVLEEAAGKPDPEKAILDLNVVDPASGSGHFLIAAAHRIARRLAQARTGDDEPTPQATRSALRDTIAHCIYGVDLNDMAAELCKVALWLEALTPGRPLTFLDHHIKTGNSLIGAPLDKATSQLVRDGIPDDAYLALLGDDTKTTTAAKRRNREERAGQAGLFGSRGPDLGADLAAALQRLEAAPEDDIAATRAKEAAYREVERHQSALKAHTLSDAWTAAFFWPTKPGLPAPITTEDLRQLETGRHLTQERRAVIDELRDRHRFFHWRLEFADVFHGQQPGFDVVLGNPPWERIKLQEQEWFAGRDEHITNAPNAAERKRRIKALREDNPALFEAYQADLRAAEGESHFARNSGNFPLNGRGDINTYAIFAELDRALTRPTGRAGFIVPSGIATDHTTQHYFRAITENHNLVSLYDFENRRALFPGVHRSYKFALLTLSGSARPINEAWYVFFAHEPADINDPEKRFTLTAADIKLLNPNTRTAPTFRTRRDAEITKRIYQRFPVLINEETGENPWGISFLRMFDMSNDSGLFRTRQQLENQGYELDGNIFRKGKATYLPLYEAKMIHHFDHRYATYQPDGSIRDTTLEEHQDPSF
ncbi:MAG: N-6 DNA methylase, partial [Trueperaceae bacterium]|nr:N-6 DNA methylase [Trueperaceae bacterium]